MGSSLLEFIRHVLYRRALRRHGSPGLHEPWLPASKGLLRAEPRMVLLLTHKQPFLTWLHGLRDRNYEEVTFADLQMDAHAYLIPVSTGSAWEWNPEIVDAYVDEYYGKFFAQELERWERRPEKWPQKTHLEDVP